MTTTMNAESRVERAPEQEFDDGVDYAQYRSLNVAGVASLALGALSIFALVDFFPMKVIPLAGIAAGVIALRQFRRYPEEYSGFKLAVSGLLASIGLLCGGIGLSVYSYATELREGYSRISYDALQPKGEVDPEFFSPPESARDLNGAKVFIKGYAYSPTGGYETGIKEFILVRDRGDCCFGGDPKISDMIHVRLKPGLSLTWSMRLQKLHGTLRVLTRPGKGIDGLGEYVYHLDADYLD